MSNATLLGAAPQKNNISQVKSACIFKYTNFYATNLARNNIGVDAEISFRYACSDKKTKTILLQPVGKSELF